jgi:hypothetical protein
MLQPSFDLPAGTTLVHGPGLGSQPLVAGSQPEVVQLAGAATTPAVAPMSRESERQVAGLVIVFAIVTIGGVAAGHASLLQQRLAQRSA